MTCLHKAFKQSFDASQRNQLFFQSKVQVTIQTLMFAIVEEEYHFSGYLLVEGDVAAKDVIQQDLQQIHGDLDLHPYQSSQLSLPYSALISFILFFQILYLSSSVMRKNRTIGIKQLHGYSLFHIWIDIVVWYLSIHLFVVVAGNLVLLVGFDKLAFLDFIVALSVYHILCFSANAIVLTFIVWRLVTQIDIPAILKRKSQTFTIGFIEQIIRPLILLGSVILLLIMIERTQSIVQYYRTDDADWQSSKDLYLVTGVRNITYDSLTSKEFGDTQKVLYNALEKEGAILADFRLVTGDFGVDGVVNVNYLKRHLIKDENHHDMALSQLIQTQQRILLVPEINKEYKTAIVDKYVEANGLPDSSSIDVVFMASNQRFFTYALPMEGVSSSYITNPIISLHTQENQYYFAYDVIAGTMHNPFKISITDDFTFDQYNNVLLSNNMLTHYTKPVSVYDQVSARIQKTCDELSYLVVSLAITFAFIGYYLYRNLLSYVLNHIQCISVKKLLGCDYIDKYGVILLRNGFGWMVAATLFITGTELLVQLQVMGNNTLKNAIYIGGILIVLENIISIALLRYLEQKKIIETLKGDRD